MEDYSSCRYSMTMNLMIEEPDAPKRGTSGSGVAAEEGNFPADHDLLRIPECISPSEA